MVEKVTIGNCELWHGDSLEVLGLIRETVDAVVTDPPYSSGGQFRGDRHAQNRNACTPLKLWCAMPSGLSKSHAAQPPYEG